MADKALTLRLNKVLRELNISLDRAVEYLSKVGCEIEARPTTKISQETYKLLFGILLFTSIHLKRTQNN